MISWQKVTEKDLMKGKVGIKLFLKRLQIFTTETLEVQQAFLQILKVQIYSEISFSKHVFKGFISFISRYCFYLYFYPLSLRVYFCISISHTYSHTLEMSI